MTAALYRRLDDIFEELLRAYAYPEAEQSPVKVGIE